MIGGFVKVIGRGVKSGASASAKTRPGQYLSGGAKGLFKGGIAATSIGLGINSYGNDYGAGFGAAYGALSLTIYVGPAIFIGELGYTVLEYGNKVYKENRRTEFGGPEKVSDLFGTLATMRQRSAANLSRGRSILGQEARLYHF